MFTEVWPYVIPSKFVCLRPEILKIRSETHLSTLLVSFILKVVTDFEFMRILQFATMKFISISDSCFSVATAVSGSLLVSQLDHHSMYGQGYLFP